MTKTLNFSLEKCIFTQLYVHKILDRQLFFFFFFPLSNTWFSISQNIFRIYTDVVLEEEKHLSASTAFNASFKVGITDIHALFTLSVTAVFFGFHLHGSFENVIIQQFFSALYVCISVHVFLESNFQGHRNMLAHVFKQLLCIFQVHRFSMRMLGS